MQNLRRAVFAGLVAGTLSKGRPRRPGMGLRRGQRTAVPRSHLLLQPRLPRQPEQRRAQPLQAQERAQRLPRGSHPGPAPPVRLRLHAGQPRLRPRRPCHARPATGQRRRPHRHRQPAGRRRRPSRPSLRQGRWRPQATPRRNPPEVRPDHHQRAGVRRQQQPHAGRHGLRPAAGGPLVRRAAARGGRFTAASGPGESKVRGDISTVYGRLGAYPVRLDAVGFLGGQWQATERLQLSLYASRFDDIWQQAYFGASHRQPLGGERALRVDLDAYRTRDSGQSRFGRIDTLASSWPWATNRGRSASPWPTSVSMASSRSTTWPSATGAPARPWYWPTRWATPTSTDRASVPGNYAMTWTSARSACLGSACMRCMPAAVPGPAPAVPPRASTPDSTGVTGGTGKATSASPIGSRRAPSPASRCAPRGGLAPGQRELSRRRHRRNPAGRRLLPLDLVTPQAAPRWPDRLHARGSNWMNKGVESSTSSVVISTMPATSFTGPS